jgi:hypothetical protein
VHASLRGQREASVSGQSSSFGHTRLSACANRKSANVSCHTAAQHRLPSRRASSFPPRSVHALPSCAASDHSAPQSLPAGKPQRPSSRPIGRPFCRLFPNPTSPQHMCAQNAAIRSQMAGGGQRRAYEELHTLSGQLL